LRMSAPGDDWPPRSANAVDNLGPTHLRLVLPYRSRGTWRIMSRPNSRLDPKLSDHELRLHGACGKERTGFPQADAAQPTEIPHPVVPETRKQPYIILSLSTVMINEDV
jgi:hypothetical protein